MRVYLIEYRFIKCQWFSGWPVSGWIERDSWLRLRSAPASLRRHMRARFFRELSGLAGFCFRRFPLQLVVDELLGRRDSDG